MHTRQHIKAAAGGTAPGKKMTRAEAARHASLVRWKKEQPFAANVAERLAQIRAARAGKGKKKGGGGKAKAGAKPKVDKQQQVAANRAAALDKLSSKPNAASLSALDALRKGEAADPDMAEALAGETGLVQKRKDGTYTLSAAGRRFMAALDKGDAAGAADAQSAGAAATDKEAARQQKKAEREKAKAERGKAREKRREKREAKPKEEAKPAAADKPDPREAERAQRQKEHAEDRAAAQADRAQRNKERTEDRATRAKDKAQRDKERAEDRAERKKEREARAKERSAAGKKKQQQAIESEVARIAAARARKNMDELYSVIDELKAIHDEALEVVEDDADLSAIKAGRRNASGDQARIDEGYALSMQLCDLFEALGATVEEEEGEEEMEVMEGKAAGELFYLGDAVKALDGDRVGALAVRFGSETEPDMSPLRDYFTKSTDFWLDAWDRRPMLFHHAMDEDTSDAPRIGTWTKAEIKDEGVWLEGQLDKAHRYYGAIKELVKRGVLRLSSDSAPHLVRRETKGNTHEVKRWPLLAASLTPTPAEPRLTAVSFKALVAELGLNDTSDNPEAPQEAGERPDEVKAQSDRARRLTLAVRLLRLKETTR